MDESWLMEPVFNNLNDELMLKIVWTCCRFDIFVCRVFESRAGFLRSTSTPISVNEGQRGQLPWKRVRENLWWSRLLINAVDKYMLFACSLNSEVKSLQGKSGSVPEFAFLGVVVASFIMFGLWHRAWGVWTMVGHLAIYIYRFVPTVKCSYGQGNTR